MNTSMTQWFVLILVSDAAASLLPPVIECGDFWFQKVRKQCSMLNLSAENLAEMGF